MLMVSCQLLEGEVCSCLHEKEKNKWELSGRDLCSERKVRCRGWFHFLIKEDSNSERQEKNKVLVENNQRPVH